MRGGRSGHDDDRLACAVAAARTAGLACPDAGAPAYSDEASAPGELRFGPVSNRWRSSSSEHPMPSRNATVNVAAAVVGSLAVNLLADGTAPRSA